MQGHKGAAALICLFVLTGFLAVHETGVAPWLKSSSAAGGWGTVRFAVTADLAQPTEASAQNVFTEGVQFTWQELVEAVIEQGVPYDINAQLSTALSSSASESCNALQQQASQADACVRLESRQSLFVMLCMESGNAAGTLLIYSLEPTGAVLAQSKTPGARGNIYRIRLSGPEILQPELHYCGTVAAAAISVTCPGSYHLEVLQLYQGFGYAAPPFVLADMHAANHTFQAISHEARDQQQLPSLAQHPCHVQEATATLPAAAAVTEQQVKAAQSRPGNTTLAVPTSSQEATIKSQHHQGTTPPGRNTTNSGNSNSSSSSPSHNPSISGSNHNNSTGSCTTCSGYNHAGRWVVVPSADAMQLASLQQALQRTCAFQSVPNPGNYFGCPRSMQPFAEAEAEDHPVLEWMPYDCRYRKITPVVGAQCKAALQKQQPRKYVCFIGDSQTRHLYNQVLHLIEGPAAGYRQMFNGSGRVHSVLKSDVLLYQEDTYGDNALKLNTSNCSLVFFNFGQWPMSFVQPQPWDVRRYARQVARLAFAMKQQQQQHANHQFWLTTLPIPVVNMHQHKTTQLGVDWRTDPFIMLFNKVASTVMQAHGIPVVDIYSIASPLFDMSYDAGHYIGTVGLALASMVANIVCSGLL